MHFDADPQPIMIIPSVGTNQLPGEALRRILKNPAGLREPMYQ